MHMSSIKLFLGLMRESRRRYLGVSIKDCDTIASLILALVLIYEEPIDSKSLSKLIFFLILDESL